MQSSQSPALEMNENDRGCGMRGLGAAVIALDWKVRLGRLQTQQFNQIRVVVCTF